MPCAGGKLKALGLRRTGPKDMNQRVRYRSSLNPVRVSSVGAKTAVVQALSKG